MSQLPIESSHDLVYDYDIIVPHVSRPAIALLFADDHWYLPHWEDTQRRFWQSVDHVNEAARAHFDLGATTLRCLSTNYDAATGHVARIYEMENRSPAWSPPVRGRWVGRDVLDTLAFGIPAHKAIVATWLTEAEQLTPMQRRPWARRGWLDATTNWIRDQLRHMGVMFQRVEQLRTWERSCLLRVYTDVGNLYFKAVPSMFAHEPPLTQQLEQWLPGRFPHILKLDDAHHWMLMEDFGGHALEREREFVRWEAAVRRFAEIQIGLVLRKDELIALGCPNRPLDEFAANIDALLADDQALLLGKDGGLTAAEVAALRERRDEFHALSAQLVGYEIPLSLEHGDLWAGNIIVTDHDFLYFDLSDSSVAQPFFSLVLFLQDAAEAFPDIPDIRAQLRNAYLKAWALYRPIEDLQTAFAAAEILGPLHHAITYHRYILPQMKMKWEMERMIPFYLKMVPPSTFPRPSISAPSADEGEHDVADNQTPLAPDVSFQAESSDAVVPLQVPPELADLDVDTGPVADEPTDAPTDAAEYMSEQRDTEIQPQPQPYDASEQADDEADHSA